MRRSLKTVGLLSCSISFGQGFGLKSAEPGIPMPHQAGIRTQHKAT